MRASSLLKLMAGMLLTFGLSIQLLFFLYFFSPSGNTSENAPSTTSQDSMKFPRPAPTPGVRATCNSWSCRSARQTLRDGDGAISTSVGAMDGTDVAESTTPPRPSPSASKSASAAPIEADTQIPPSPHPDYFCSNRATGSDVAQIDSSSMSAYISTGGRFPIVMVTKDRPALLRATLASLLTEVRCVDAASILVVQDGSNEEVSTVATSARVILHKKLEEGPSEQDGAARIAKHYKYALEYAMGTAFPAAPGIIVVEDDFLFAPDFYEYFHAVAPVIESDKTLWLASAWNDNGFDYLVADPYALKRTGYFPGLGWLLPRHVWKTEISASWPDSHWDHWMRDPARGRGRDIVIPEIPRDYHAGVKGTFMDQGTHNKYFGSIALQADPAFTWDTRAGATELMSLVEPAYTQRLLAELSARETVHLTSIAAITAHTSGLGVVWYSCPTNVPDHTPMRPIAAFFGIWHEGARGSRGGVHSLWWLGESRLLLVNVYSSGGRGGGGMHVSGGIESASDAVVSAMPDGVVPLDWTAFTGAARPALPLHAGLFGAKIRSPLAHLSGGPDANGPPDVAVDGGADAAAAGSIQQLRRGGGHNDGPHEHGKFLSDLRVQALEGAAAGHRGDTAADAAVAPAPPRTLPRGVAVVGGTKAGQSCSDVCAAHAQRSTCVEALLPRVNTCEALQEAFPCVRCDASIGLDQPAYIDPAAPFDKQPGVCLTNGQGGKFSCAGTYVHARRLCTCKVPPVAAAAAAGGH